MERLEPWQIELAAKIRREDGPLLGREGLAIRLQQELGLTWETAITFARQIRLIPEPFVSTYSLPSRVSEVEYSEAGLELEHKRQARKLASLFAKKLGMSEEEYLKDIPPFPVRPRLKGVGARPLIVEGVRIPWREQAILSGIDIVNIPDGWVVEDISTISPAPLKPFTTWVFSHNYSWKDFEIESGTRRASLIEGIAYVNAYDYLVAGNRFWLNGSQITSSSEKYLLYLSGESLPPSLCSISEESRMKHMPASFSVCFVSLFTGREIRT